MLSVRIARELLFLSFVTLSGRQFMCSVMATLCSMSLGLDGYPVRDNDLASAIKQYYIRFV